MLRFAVRRLLETLVTLVGVLSLVFALLSAAPGDPARLMARAGGHGTAAAPEAVAAFRASYGLDRPLIVRFGTWLANAATLDLGRSFLDGRPVVTRIAETLPVTLTLNLAALLVAALVAVPLGVLCARHPGGLLDRASALLLDLLFAIPSFALGLLLLLVFSVRLGWLPLFADPSLGLAGLVLPVVTLALPSLSLLARFVAAALRQALAAPSSLAGLSRGESDGEQMTRATRRAVGPFLAMGTALLPTAISGSVLVERLFSVHGSGGLLAEAVFARDLPTVLGLTLLGAVAVLLTRVLADLVLALLDPRTRDAGGGLDSA